MKVISVLAKIVAGIFALFVGLLAVVISIITGMARKIH